MERCFKTMFTNMTDVLFVLTSQVNYARDIDMAPGIGIIKLLDEFWYDWKDLYELIKKILEVKKNGEFNFRE